MLKASQFIATASLSSELQMWKCNKPPQHLLHIQKCHQCQCFQTGFWASFLTYYSRSREWHLHSAPIAQTKTFSVSGLFSLSHLPIPFLQHILFGRALKFIQNLSTSHLPTFTAIIPVQTTWIIVLVFLLVSLFPYLSTVHKIAWGSFFQS